MIKNTDCEDLNEAEECFKTSLSLLEQINLPTKRVKKLEVQQPSDSPLKKVEVSVAEKSDFNSLVPFTPKNKVVKLGRLGVNASRVVLDC